MIKLYSPLYWILDSENEPVQRCLVKVVRIDDHSDVASFSYRYRSYADKHAASLTSRLHSMSAYDFSELWNRSRSAG